MSLLTKGRSTIDFFLLLICFLFCPLTFANVAETYGFGSRTAGLAGAVVAQGGDAFAAYYNPAALAHNQDQRLRISWGMLYMQPRFLPINNVVTENSFNSDREQGNPNYDNVDVTYKPTFGQVLGLSYRLLPDFGNLSVGLVTFFPLEQLAYMDTGEAYVPEYVLYRARTQRPQFELGVGAELGAGLSVGAGLHIAYSLTSNAPAFINAGENTVSSMRFTGSLKPKAAPYFGVQFIPQTASKSLSFGAVLRLPVAFDNYVALSSGARMMGRLAALPIHFFATAALYYDPMAVELGNSWQITQRLRLFAQMDYQLWSQFKAPALLIQQPENSDAPRISAGAIPTYNYVNIWVPRVGQEIALTDKATLRFGYAYRPSIMNEIPLEAGNYLDPPKHMVNVGFSYSFSRFLGFSTPATLDAHLSYQRLLSQLVIKTPGNEAGLSEDLKIGATNPNEAEGYQAGGNIIGGGLSLSFAF